jgi:O-antigen/teichoic acid export membrane protein
MSQQEREELRLIARILCFVSSLIGFLLIFPGLIYFFVFLPRYKLAELDDRPHYRLSILSIIFGGPFLMASGIILLLSRNRGEY